MLKHEQRTPSGMGRYCARHQMIHGYLYLCESYSDELKEAIKRKDAQKTNVLRISIAIYIIFIILVIITSL